MPNQVEIRITSSYDGTGVQQGTESLEKYERTVQRLKEQERQRTLIEPFRSRLRPQDIAVARGGTLSPEHIEALRKLGINPDMIAPLQQAAAGIPQTTQAPSPGSTPTPPPGRATSGAGGTAGTGGFEIPGLFNPRMLLGMGLFSAIRGMPIAEQEAALRYQVAAPGVRPRDQSVDEFGTAVSEAGRAMSFSRQETLAAAAAYNKLAGTVGRQLVPEMEQLTQVSRYHRMELSQGAEFFGSMRRLTRADDPNALRMIASTVRTTMESAGPHRRDELRDAVMALTERAARGRIEAMDPETMAALGVMMTRMHGSGLPGLEGKRGGDALSSFLGGIGLSGQDPTDVSRWAVASGQTGTLQGNPFAVIGRHREQLERIKRGDLGQEDDRQALWNAIQYGRRIGGPEEVGQREGVRRVLQETGVSGDQLKALMATAFKGTFQDFNAEIQQRMQQQKALGPEAEQAKAMHLANQEARRHITDALGQLGTYATEIRNVALEKVSGMAGGGRSGDMAALALSTLAQGGMYYAGYSTLSRMGLFGSRGRRGIFGRGGRMFGRGAMPRMRWGGSGAERFLRGGRSRSGASVRGIMARRFYRTRIAPYGRAASGVGAFGAFMGQGYLESMAREREGVEAARYQLGARVAGIGGWAMAGGAVAGPYGALAAGGAALAFGQGSGEWDIRRDAGKATMRNLAEKGQQQPWLWGYGKGTAEDIVGAGFGKTMLDLAGYGFGSRIADRLTYGDWRKRADISGKELQQSEDKLGRLRGDPAAFALMREMYGDKYQEALNAYQLRRGDKVSPAAAFQEARETMEREHGVTLTDEQSAKARGMLTQRAASGQSRAGDGRLDVNVNVNFNGAGDLATLAKGIGEPVAEMLERELPNIYQPLSSGYSTNGRLA